MSAMSAKFEAEYEAAREHLHAALAHLKEIGHDAWAHVEQALHALEGDAPKLADEAKTDAEQVVTTAATEGVIPAEHAAEGDAVQLAQDAVHDVADALAGSTKPTAAEPGTTSTNA